MSIQTRVQAGAALLDERLPGWEQRINVATLDVADYHNCVLGQLFGDYSTGAEALFPGEYGGHDVEQAAGHGFTSDVAGYRSYGWDHDALTAQWRAVLAERTLVAV